MPLLDCDLSDRSPLSGLHAHAAPSHSNALFVMASYNSNVMPTPLSSFITSSKVWAFRAATPQ